MNGSPFYHYFTFAGNVLQFHGKYFLCKENISKILAHTMNAILVQYSAHYKNIALLLVYFILKVTSADHEVMSIFNNV